MRRTRIFGAVGAWIIAVGSLSAAPLQPPIAFDSANGELNLVMTATSAPVTFDSATTTGWVYEVCKRATRFDTSCLPNPFARLSSQSFYGGVVLRLRANDTLNIRLVNNLPPVQDAKHCFENPVLANNPTNLHTHGLIVEPYRSAGGSDPYGDYVFVEVHNPANNVTCANPARRPSASAKVSGAMPMPNGMAGHSHAHSHGSMHVPGSVADGTHPDMDVAYGAVEYSIRLNNHPSGLFWFHPHMHGVALNQVSAGLAGAITVGDVADECGDIAGCASSAANSRVMILKDTQILGDGTLLNQQEPTFCNGLPPDPDARPAQRIIPLGKCVGIGDYLNGNWYHTINGQVFPDINVGSDGEIWRFVNASASRSYDLFLQADEDGSLIPLQLISIDGVAIDVPPGSNLATLQTQLGKKAKIFSCSPSSVASSGAVCATHIEMMPSSRVTVRVVNDKPAYRTAVLQTGEYITGPIGDDWPAVLLAAVTLAAPSPDAAKPVAFQGGVKAVVGPSGVLGSPPLMSAPGIDRPLPFRQVQTAMRNVGSVPANMSPLLSQTTRYAIDPALKFGYRADPACQNLAPGEHRRIYFGNPDPSGGGFGLATSIVGADGVERIETTTPMRSFDPSQTTICLTANGSDGPPTTETWELVGLTGEDHNFHIHQTRFYLLSDGSQPVADQPAPMVLQDNVPVYHAADSTNCDGSVENFRSGACAPNIITVRIPFTQIGDFVFHCHILEHEDGGMMARIRVVAPSPFFSSSRH